MSELVHHLLCSTMIIVLLAHIALLAIGIVFADDEEPRL